MLLKADSMLTLPPLQTAYANPFFDNIRQNRELAQGVTETIPLDLPSMTKEEHDSLPRFLQNLLALTPGERAKTLAQNFYDIDRAEQDRLNATMKQHAAESSIDPRNAQTGASGDAADGFPSRAAGVAGASSLSSHFCSVSSPSASERFPFSIAAALERGADNRYNNIWTYEHSRVRLSHPQVPSDPGSDYLNGSFVEPARKYGSPRRFIATQAPLPSTFDAFWQAIWEQNSHVIVMLCRERESGRQQSNDYWSGVHSGKLYQSEPVDEVRITKDGDILDPPSEKKPAGGGGDDGGFFTMADAGSSEDSQNEPSIIRRTIKVTNKTRPDQKPRHIVQLHYVDWPDYYVPDNAGSLLNLMELADQTQHKIDQELLAMYSPLSRPSGQARSKVGPMVVHCSAGVGRTGVYVVVNSILDAIRREKRAQTENGELSCWDNGIVPATQPFALKLGDLRSYDSGRLTRMSSVTSDSSTRKSLKRELSPSDASMGTDSSDAADGLSSPPPAFRRTRSREPTSEDSVAQLRKASPLMTPSRALNSLNLASSPPAPSEPPLAASIGTPMEDVVHHSAEMSREQSNTSNAESTGTDLASVSSGGVASSFDTSSSDRAGPTSGTSSVLFVGGRPRTSSTELTTPQDQQHVGEESALNTELDVVKETTETVRQQRMSSIQTARQYVFVHTAIIEGCLRDFRRRAEKQAKRSSTLQAHK